MMLMKMSAGNSEAMSPTINSRMSDLGQILGELSLVFLEFLERIFELGTSTSFKPLRLTFDAGHVLQEKILENGAFRVRSDVEFQQFVTLLFYLLMLCTGSQIILLGNFEKMSHAKNVWSRFKNARDCLFAAGTSRNKTIRKLLELHVLLLILFLMPLYVGKGSIQVVSQ
jgi:hypothetical protein